MELYKIGHIISVGKTYIIFEHNSDGLIIYVARPTTWSISGDQVLQKVYVYRHVSEYMAAYYGFKSFAERVLFEDLLTVSGIGPKTAIALLREGEPEISRLIAQGNVAALASIPQAGMKTANQIVFDLQQKYERFVERKSASDGVVKYSPREIKSSLRALGFSVKQIDYALEKIEPSSSVESMVEQAIKIISHAKLA